MFSGKHEHKIIDSKVFLDRDGPTFKTLVNYLRNEQELLPEFDSKNSEMMFYKELQFWEIGEYHRKKDKSPKKYELEIDDYVSPYSIKKNDP